MKLIDIYVKIANDEEVPKKVKFDDKIYTYKPEWKDYADEDEHYGLLVDTIPSTYQITKMLNEEIEIIEEDKKIEKVLDIELLGGCDNWIINPATNTKQGLEINPYILEAITRNFKELYHKQCELIDEINKLKGDNDDR